VPLPCLISKILGACVKEKKGDKFQTLFGSLFVHYVRKACGEELVAIVEM
jgi:hypothetical protein